MRRLLGIAIAFYIPHLLDEALTRMHDDRLIVAAYAMLAPLGARPAAYLAFQLTFALGLAMTWLFARGGVARRIVMAALAVALLAESHHIVRALFTFTFNSGLVTSLPLPWIGLLIVRHLASSRKKLTCSTTFSSPWVSAASFSDSRHSSPPPPSRAFSAFPRNTTTPPLA
jgi:hypothetical protein